MGNLTAWQNWAGNQKATAAAVVRPTTTDAVAEAVRVAIGTGTTVKPVGSGHSFTSAAATTGMRLDLSGLSGLVSLSRASKLIRVKAGTQLSLLNLELARQGLAMPNLGDIDVQTVSGALATGTHGTGKGYGCLSTFVVELELVTGTGEIVRCSRDQNAELFMAALVGIGAVGVVTEVTLRGVDAFVLHADERPTPLGEVLAKRSRAALSLARGDAEAAARTAREACALARDAGLQLEGRRAQVLLGRALAAGGDRTAAIRELRDAEIALDAGRAHTHRDEARRELRKLGHRVDQARRRGAPTGALAGLAALSAREREVVALVAAGRTNPAIAEELFLSRSRPSRRTCATSSASSASPHGPRSPPRSPATRTRLNSASAAWSPRPGRKAPGRAATSRA